MLKEYASLHMCVDVLFNCVQMSDMHLATTVDIESFRCDFVNSSLLFMLKIKLIKCVYTWIDYKEGNVNSFWYANKRE